VYLFYLSFAGLGHGVVLKRAGLGFVFGLGTVGLGYKTVSD